MPETFIEVARADEVLPGSMLRVDVGGRRLLLANVGGHYYAADDTCTHEDASLSSGALDGTLVKCPLHGSRFDLRTGAVLEDPAEDNLKTYPVRIDGERILVGWSGTDAR
jgi:nitrite reductase/ring-hydroxylating ferredoxin subunit